MVWAPWSVDPKIAAAADAPVAGTAAALATAAAAASAVIEDSKFI